MERWPNSQHRPASLSLADPIHKATAHPVISSILAVRRFIDFASRCEQDCCLSGRDTQVSMPESPVFSFVSPPSQVSHISAKSITQIRRISPPWT